MDKKIINTLLNKLSDLFDNDSIAEDAINVLKQKVLELPENNKMPSSNSMHDVPIEVSGKDGSYAVFSDGACRGNPGPGSWGVIAQDNQGELLFESSGFSMNTTNNKMELKGAIQGLVELDNYLRTEKDGIYSGIYLYSDSQYVVKGAQQWISGWKKRGWKKADKKAPENLELWQELDGQIQKMNNITFLWVKGHDGHPQNERCDEIANQALDDLGY